MDKEMKVLYSDSTNLINMSKEKFMNLFLIDISVDGETIPFVFDTGATITVISESVANSVNTIILPDTVRAGGNTGSVESFSKRKISTFNIGNNSVEDLSVIVVPDKQLHFGIDKEGNDLSVSGFLGWDIISKFKWTIDPIGRTYTIEKPKWYENKQRLYWDNMPIINAQYDNHHMYFGFDSGNTESTFSKEFIPYLKDRQKRIDDIAGVGEKIEEEVYEIKGIELKVSNKNIELRNISVLKRDVFPTTQFKVTGLLAADIIQKHKCVIDFINQDFQLIN